MILCNRCLSLWHHLFVLPPKETISNMDTKYENNKDHEMIQLDGKKVFFVILVCSLQFLLRKGGGKWRSSVWLQTLQMFWDSAIKWIWQTLSSRHSQLKVGIWHISVASQKSAHDCCDVSCKSVHKFLTSTQEISCQNQSTDLCELTLVMKTGKGEIVKALSHRCLVVTGASLRCFVAFWFDVSTQDANRDELVWTRSFTFLPLKNTKSCSRPLRFRLDKTFAPAPCVLLPPSRCLHRFCPHQGVSPPPAKVLLSLHFTAAAKSKYLAFVAKSLVVHFLNKLLLLHTVQFVCLCVLAAFMRIDFW